MTATKRALAYAIPVFLTSGFIAQVMKTKARGFWLWWCGAAGLVALLLGFMMLRGEADPQEQPYASWSDYGGSANSMQYSALTQIDKTNVHKLDLVWFYPAPGPSGRFAFNPLIVDDVMYVGGEKAVIALDAATGRKIWSRATEGQPTDRGFNYWESPGRSDRRLIFAANSYLQQIDARTGKPIRSFGNNGRVNLREGLGRDPEAIRRIQSGTPGRVFENLIILGSATGEGYGSPPGDIRAYDVLTGELVWTFRTIPRPGEYGYETWPPDAWKYGGGANAWGEISIDEERGIAYCPTGSPTFDRYGGDRIGANLFGNCLLALDARTGKRLWHFQTVHHDLWDYDLATAPKLLTVRRSGRVVDIVAQPTKFGLLYVFDRVTGEPLWPIEDRPVPKSDVPGEEAWPTQPFPTKPPPFARLKFTAEDINPYVDPEEQKRLREILLTARNEGIFTPPTVTRGAMTIPGGLGGSNFGGSAADPETGMLYVRTADQPAIHRLREWSPPAVQARGETPGERGHSVYAQLCETCHGSNRDFLAAPKELGVDRFKSIIREGIGPMPGFSEATLSPANLNVLMAYLDNPTTSPTPPRRPPPPSPPLPGVQVRYTEQHGPERTANNGLPLISPPWARIVAYDLNEGTIKWEAPLGTVPALAAEGITDTGNAHLVHRNGPVVTAGGLIFVGTWGDRTIRAFDKDTGEILWEAELKANPEGIAAVYEVGGRQYVAFYASGSQDSEDRSADEQETQSIAFIRGKRESQGYYVFALPQKTASKK